MSTTLIVTNAGRAALINAANTGTAPVTIAAVGVSPRALVPSVTATSLPGEIKRIATLSGDVVDDDTIHLIVRDESNQVFTVRSFALYLQDGTLFAIYGQADVLIEKSAQAVMLLPVDIRFADIDADRIAFGDTNFLNPPATTEQIGVVELATEAEVIGATDTVRAVTPKSVKAALDARFGVGNEKVWHAGNDGSGSALDADTLDGLHAGDFIRTRNGGTVVTELGPFGLVTLSQSGAAGGVGGWNRYHILANGAGYNAGGTFGTLGSGDAIRFCYIAAAQDNIGGAYLSNNNLRIYPDRPAWGTNTIYHTGNDGSGSGLDADLLDGQHGSYYTNIIARLGYTPLNAASYTAADVRAKLLTVDGSGSGIDADLLDGVQGDDYFSRRSGIIQNPDTAIAPGAYSVQNPGHQSNMLVWSPVGLTSTGTVQLESHYTGVLRWRGRTNELVWTEWRNIYHTGNDGAGSGLDADTVDGVHASEFIRQNHGGRPVRYDQGGSMVIKGSIGGWTLAYNFEGNEGTYLGGFGASGGANIVNYLWMGPAYNNVNSIRAYPDRPTWGTNTIWHAGNDGGGSGLDADTVDGVHASEFIRQNTGHRPVSYNPANGSMAIKGNAAGWAVSYGFKGSNDSWRGGFGAHGAADDLGFFWIGPDYNKVNSLRVYPDRPAWGTNTIWHAGNDGSGSGLDADLLDGLQGSYYSNIPARLGYIPLNAAAYTATDVRAKILTVDGSGSGIDADTVDGLHAASLVKHSDFTSGSNANGYWRKLPDGLIEQWGRVTTSGTERSYDRTFPIPFTDAASINISATGIYRTSIDDIYPVVRGVPTTTNFTIFQQAIGPEELSSGFYWRAIGF